MQGQRILFYTSNNKYESKNWKKRVSSLPVAVENLYFFYSLYNVSIKAVFIIKHNYMWKKFWHYT
jgi:hypothetical protein